MVDVRANMAAVTESYVEKRLLVYSWLNLTQHNYWGKTLSLDLAKQPSCFPRIKQCHLSPTMSTCHQPTANLPNNEVSSA